MRPGLKLELDLRTCPPFGLAALYRMRRVVSSSALGDPSVEDDLDAAVRSEAFTQIRV